MAWLLLSSLLVASNALAVPVPGYARLPGTLQAHEEARAPAEAQVPGSAWVQDVAYVPDVAWVPDTFQEESREIPPFLKVFVGNSSKVPKQEKSLCMMGKLLPSFYLLGAKNCATSSLAADLVNQGYITAPNGKLYKEWFFFQQYQQQHKEDFDKEAMKQEWFSSFMECPKKFTRMADFSVPNLFMVPIPPPLQHSKNYGYPARGFNTELWSTPQFLKEAYGPAAQYVTFAILLREPLARSQSEWYHTKPLKNCAGCMARNTFPEALEFNSNLAMRSPPQISDWMWKSLYARQIDSYLQHWDADQFVIIPFKRYVATDTMGISSYFINRLGLESEAWGKSTHANSHKHKSVAEEAPAGSAAQRAFSGFMQGENERLVRVLARSSVHGMELQGYDGAPGDEVATRLWLEANW